MIYRYQGEYKFTKDFKYEGFLEKTFDRFLIELRQIATEFYPKNEKEVFNCIERQWIGIFNNAVIKSHRFDEATTLQEYSVPLAEKQYGRADYLVRLNNIDMLFEAKMYEEKGSACNDEEMEDDYFRVLRQAAKYLNFNQRESYKEELYLVAIYFGWIRSEEVLNKAKLAMNVGRGTSDKTNFCSLFCNEISGVWVYGRIVNANDLK